MERPHRGLKHHFFKKLYQRAKITVDGMKKKKTRSRGNEMVKRDELPDNSLSAMANITDASIGISVRMINPPSVSRLLIIYRRDALKRETWTTDPDPHIIQYASIRGCGCLHRSDGPH